MRKIITIIILVLFPIVCIASNHITKNTMSKKKTAKVSKSKARKSYPIMTRGISQSRGNEMMEMARSMSKKKKR
jgi:uncharacterized alpha/beta hydrolase family protein